MAAVTKIPDMYRAGLVLTYDGKNISADVAPSVTSFSYTDHEGGKADDLSVALEDRDGLWKNAWFPQKGAILKATVNAEIGGKTHTLNCGVFSLDEIAVQGPPDTVNIKGVSSLTGKALKQETRSRAWESVTFEEVAARIAKDHKLDFFYKGSKPIPFKRVDQRQESDLAFLNRLCRDYDMNLKISGEKLILAENRAMETADPVFSITRGKSPVGSYRFSTRTVGIFKGCEVSYWDAEKKTALIHTFTPPQAPPVGQMLKVNQRAEDKSAAEYLAIASLRAKNGKEVTGEFSLMGDPVLLAGLTGTIKGFGEFDGKYIITQAVHAQDRGQGYRTTIQIRKALKW